MSQSQYVHRSRQTESIGVVPLTKAELGSWLDTQSQHVQQWVAGNEFKADPYTVCVLPDQAGKIARVLAGVKAYDDPWCLGHCPMQLPSGIYHIEKGISGPNSPGQWQQMSLSWVLGAYRFDRYQSQTGKPNPILAVDDSVIDVNALAIMTSSYTHVRDLINTPAQDLMPAEFARFCHDMAMQWGAEYREIVGETALKEANLHAIATVGQASVYEARLVELTWGDPTHRHLTLVGKGVCFDTGGLNIKTGNGLLLMKKDMGGAALALGLGELIISHKLPVYLRILLPMVDNAIGGQAYRPSDVINTHKGLTVEITDTDAEGRLILADALSYAQTDPNLDLLMDFATLTGAARVAVGPDIPSFFTDDTTISEQLSQAMNQTQETLWPLPLYADYHRYLKSRIADLKNASLEYYAGAITAALFLQRFVEATVPWVHIDFMGWNVNNAPARPEGGEAQGLGTLFQFVCDRYGLK